MTDKNQDIQVNADELRRLVANKLEGAGLIRKHAEMTADVLVCADERGVYSHGIIQTEHYVKRLQSGSLNKNPNFTFRTLRSGSALLNADGGMGHVASIEAMNHAIEMAPESGIAMVGVEDSSHCGALSYFVLQAANKGLIGLSLVQTDKCVTPFGGVNPFFGTNPIAFGFPCKRNPSVIIDMATSSVSSGKILHAREKNIEIPEGWGLDCDGRPTTDPSQVFGLTPLGGYKGYAIGMAIDVLTGVLLGAQFGPHINSMYGDYEKKRNLAALMIAIDPSTFISTEAFMRQRDAMVDQLHAVPAGPGCDQVLVPGDPELIKESAARKNGVTVIASTYEYLMGSA
ncbi:MAG: ureidoglycolate dehydrogenase [Desulfuromusa sp.]|nr:ureidoglycolate dehydrogenase [Desulfuromusa sp.]